MHSTETHGWTKHEHPKQPMLMPGRCSAISAVLSCKHCRQQDSTPFAGCVQRSESDGGMLLV